MTSGSRSHLRLVVTAPDAASEARELERAGIEEWAARSWVDEDADLFDPTVRRPIRWDPVRGFVDAEAK
jgi:hypothetical protein